jgi:hypothetical protein
VLFFFIENSVADPDVSVCFTFLGHPDPLVRGAGPAPDPDPFQDSSCIKQNYQEKP